MLEFSVGETVSWGRGSLYFRTCFGLDSAPPDESASGNFAAGPPVDLSLANYRYVAVDDAAQKIRKAHWATRPITFSPDGYAIVGDTVFHPLSAKADQPIGNYHYFAFGYCSNGAGCCLSKANGRCGCRVVWICRIICWILSLGGSARKAARVPQVSKA